MKITKLKNLYTSVPLWQVLAFTLLFLVYLTAQAKIESLEFNSPQMEADYNVLIDELRCLVCQNQNLADSNAELAQDLRKQTYEMLQQGKSREEVVDFMVTRYGDFVLYRPPFKLTTLLLWLGPLLLFLIALTIVVTFFRKQQQTPVNVSDQEKTRAHSLLDDD
ncbi:MAG: cytochrome c-type biogenesis protein [Gammaproteobacteria bacterium]